MDNGFWLQNIKHSASTIITSTTRHASIPTHNDRSHQKPELCPPVASALSSLLPSIPHLRHAVKKNGYVPDEHLHPGGRDVTFDGAPRLLEAEDLTDGQRAAFVRNHIADVDLFRWPVDRLLLQALFRLTFYASHPQSDNPPQAKKKWTWTLQWHHTYKLW